MKYRIFSVLMVLGMVAFMCVITSTPVSASATATRDLPNTVLPNTQFDVTVDVNGCGVAGQVIETLPFGFTYVGIDDPLDYNVTINGQTVTITFIGASKNITYQVMSPATQSIYTFSGIATGDDMVADSVGGDTTINVTAGPPWSYDTDQDGVVSKQEALVAVVDFFAGQITRQQALEVIVLFFETYEPPIVGTSWQYAVNYDCDEMGVSGYWITLQNDTTWAMTVTGTEQVSGVDTYKTESVITGDALRRYPYPGGITPAMDVPVTLAPTGVGPTVHRSVEHGSIINELFPLEANAMGGITLDVARSYTYNSRPATLSVGGTWTYTTQMDLDNFMFHESMTWNATVTSIENITVPLGTYQCYKIEATGTGGENPNATNYYWWDVNDNFLCPVKHQYNYIFMGSETRELSLYTPAS